MDFQYNVVCVRDWIGKNEGHNFANFANFANMSKEHSLLNIDTNVQMDMIRIASTHEDEVQAPKSRQRTFPRFRLSVGAKKKQEPVEEFEVIPSAPFRSEPEEHTL